MRRAAVAVALASALAACAAPRPRPVQLAMQIDRDGEASCRVEIAGRRFALPAGEAALLAFLRARAGADPELILSGGPNTPYRCIGHAIELAYRAGFTRVGFLSEPAPDKRR